MPLIPKPVMVTGTAMSNFLQEPFPAMSRISCLLTILIIFADTLTGMLRENKARLL